MSELSDQTITVEEYEKLQLEYIDSQKELKEITEIFEQYREETEQMEEVQSRQVEMLEQQLEKSNLEKEYLMLNLKKELQEIQLETQKLLLEKEEEVQKLRQEVKIKTLTITKFMSDYSDQREKEKSITDENDPKNEQDKDQVISKLKKEIAVKDFLINDLGNDIQKNKTVIEEQKTIFKRFSAEILEKTKERDDALRAVKDQQIDQLKTAIKEKDELIEKLEKENDPGVSEEENELMREMILQQQEKLLTLTKSFEGYRNESEKLFLGQISLRDSKIKELEAQVKSLKGETTDVTDSTQTEKTDVNDSTQTEQVQEVNDSTQTEETEQKQEGESKTKTE